MGFADKSLHSRKHGLSTRIEVDWPIDIFYFSVLEVCELKLKTVDYVTFHLSSVEHRDDVETI
jgi:hypothetical protein